MGLKKRQRIKSAIALLESHGYVVTKDFSKLLGKWVAFRRIQHGKVIKSDPNLVVKCEDCEKIVDMDDVIEFLDNEEDCYKLR